ncbi:hypothetical protein [Krasilnikovia sp. M28-CT-15]|uniref:hypothetical protein n=1 Tax=Krasilnikovia sp. M28-CT-15 TaxID=3373540 RepID=UPI0038763220
MPLSGFQRSSATNLPEPSVTDTLASPGQPGSSWSVTVNPSSALVIPQTVPAGARTALRGPAGQQVAVAAVNVAATGAGQ